MIAYHRYVGCQGAFGEPRARNLTYLDPSSRVTGAAPAGAPTGGPSSFGPSSFDTPSFTAALVARDAPPAGADEPCTDAFQRFLVNPALSAIAVVEGTRVVGLLDRARIMTTFARPLMADLYGRRPVRLLMDPSPLVVEATTPLGEVSQRIATAYPAAMVSGFVVVENGAYLGIGSAVDLMAKSVEHAEVRTRQFERARAAAEEANRAKTAFLANASHEIRTPLNAIMGFAEILQQEMLGPLGNELYREYARDIVQSGQHLMELINDLLDLSKAEANRLELLESMVDVRRVCVGCVRLMSERAMRARVDITCALTEDLPPLRADERKLRQMLLNLLSNAVKFTPPDGRITLAGGLGTGGELSLDVNDNGIGMSPAELEKALEPWGQVDTALNRRLVGTGLGLPLTKSMIELHGGRLDIASVPGQGTRMSLVFPADRVLAPVVDADSAPIGWTSEGT